MPDDPSPDQPKKEEKKSIWGRLWDTMVVEPYHAVKDAIFGPTTATR